MNGSWLLVDESGPAAELHAASAAALDTAPARRQVRVLRADAKALVLGSSQPESMFDAEAVERAGLQLARRRSGGSAVLVGPAQVLWVDLVVPAGDLLWDDDVGRASWWVGELWAAALADTGVALGAEVWKGPMRSTPWSSAICFAGIGPGEVTIAGRKVVGISQRRRSTAALFQTAVLLRWAPDEYRQLLSEYPPGSEPADLEVAATSIGADAEKSLLSALLEHLAGLVP